jgi:hypothetical protein
MRQQISFAVGQFGTNEIRGHLADKTISRKAGQDKYENYRHYRDEKISHNQAVAQAPDGLAHCKAQGLNRSGKPHDEGRQGGDELPCRGKAG